jgi:hypothetical protein
LLAKAYEYRVSSKVNLTAYNADAVNIFTISLFSASTLHWYPTFRHQVIPDFSNWKSPDAYQQAFERLLRDLKPALERKPETS